MNKILLQIWSSYLANGSLITSYCNLCRYADFVTMATVVNSCNYVTCWSVKANRQQPCHGEALAENAYSGKMTQISINMYDNQNL